MDNKMFCKLVRNHLTIIPFAGILVLLAIVGLTVLSSAQPLSVSVEKTANPSTVPYAGIVKYTVIFSNNGASDAYLEVITDTLPVGFTFLSMGAGSQLVDDPTGVTGPIVWDQGPYLVPAGDTLTLAYNVRVTAIVRPTPYENWVVARLSTGGTVSDRAPVWMVGPELAGIKSASSTQVRNGSSLQYTVSLTNIGTYSTILSAITDTLPAGFTFEQMVSGPLPAPGVQGNNLVWTGPISLAAGDSLQFTYQVRALGVVGQVYRNSVRAAFNGQTYGPFETSVQVLPCLVYLPLVLTVEGEPPPPPLTYRLAYDSKPVDNFEIYAINADKSDRLNVSQNVGGDLDPDWSPDGTQIAWVHFVDGRGEIYAANADGSGEVNLTNNPKEDRAPAWSPDGSKIAFFSYRDDRWEVYSMNADGTGQTRLTNRACQSHDPVWSPDGAKIAFICGLEENEEIYVMDANGGNQVRLTDNGVPDEAPAWSPDSTQIAYVRYSNKQKQNSEIYVVNVSTQIHTRLTDNEYADYSPAWSPDGTKIAFSTYLDGSYEIAVMDADGSDIVNLTKTAKGDFVPMWSPDGLKIAFVSTRDDDRALYVMDADGSNQLRLDLIADLSDTTLHVPVWKPK